jgi:hypothetical protein
MRMSLASAVVSALTEENTDALRPLLDANVRAAGVFVNGQGVENVLAVIASMPMPALARAIYGEPVVDGNEVVVRGELPPGHQISAVRLVLRVRDGLILEFLQEVEMTPRPMASPLIIDESIRAVIDGAFDLGSPFVVAYVDADGRPHASFRGTVQSHGDDTIALWVRDRNGGLLRGIAMNPNVALLYRDSASRSQYEITGRAREVDIEDERHRIFERCAAFERGLDPAMRGAAVVVDVDSLLGGLPAQQVYLRRDA